MLTDVLYTEHSPGQSWTGHHRRSQDYMATATMTDHRCLLLTVHCTESRLKQFHTQYTVSHKNAAVFVIITLEKLVQFLATRRRREAYVFVQYFYLFIWVYAVKWQPEWDTLSTWC